MTLSVPDFQLLYPDRIISVILKKIFLQGQNLDAKLKGDLVNLVGGCASSFAANYFMGGQQRAQSSANQNSCWDENKWDKTWSTPGNSAGT